MHIVHKICIWEEKIRCHINFVFVLVDCHGLRILLAPDWTKFIVYVLSAMWRYVIWQLSACRSLPAFAAVSTAFVEVFYNHKGYFVFKSSLQDMVSRNHLAIFTILLSSTVLAPVLAENSIPILNNHHVEVALEISCVVAADASVFDATEELLVGLTKAFILEPGVTVGKVDFDNFVWSSGKPLKTEPKEGFIPYDKVFSPLLVFEKQKKDRTCLHSSPPWNPTGQYYQGVMNIHSIIDYVNHICGTYRNSNGQISNAGHHRREILRDLFHVEMLSNSISMGDLYGTRNNPLNTSFVWRKHQNTYTKSKPRFDSDHGKIYDTCDKTEPCAMDKPTKMPECDRISSPTRNEFFEKILKKSQPVIIEGMVKDWPAYSKWTNEYFMNKFSGEKVHIKLTPTGDFEGVEKAEIWEDFDSFKIPAHIKKQLLFPDLVVVRPATSNMKLSEFLDLINSTAHQENPKLSAYLEYSSLSAAMPGAEEDVMEPEFVKRLLKRQATLECLAQWWEHSRKTAFWSIW